MTSVTDSAMAVRGLRELRERRMRTDVFRAALPVIGGVALAAVIGAAGPAGAQADPPGDNGTVKIDGVEFDALPDNQPHVGCEFQVDFYGFDKGEDLFADVTFEAIEPTGQVEPLLTDTVFIGEDDDSGGGSEAGLDASETYDLTDALQGIEPHPEQGWHVKLTVNADGSIGADTKFKVFWVSGCEAPPTTSTSSSTTSSTTSSSTTSTTEHDGSTTTVDRHETTTTVSPGGGGTEPQPGQPAMNPTSSSGGLPITGSNSLGLLALALGLLGVGAGVVLTTRRLRTTDEG
jgi:hypothetical protein